MKLSDLQYLMHQLGPATPEITTILQEAIDSWIIVFDEGVSMQIAWDDRTARVRMTCAIGRPDDGEREAIYAALLNANLLLSGVADVRLALSDDDDDVILIGEYGLVEATIDSLRQRLSEYLDHAEKFARMVTSDWSDAAPDDERPAAHRHHDLA